MGTLTVYSNRRVYRLDAVPGRNLAEILREGGVALPKGCDGHGICRRCVVELRLGTFSVADDVVTVDRGDSVPVLACETRPEEGDAEIFVREE